MFPCFAIKNIANTLLSYIVFPSKRICAIFFAEFYTVSSYIKNSFFGKFCILIFNSKKVRRVHQSIFMSMLHIMTTRTPFQIRNMIVSFVTVNMINLRMFLGILNKCKSYKSMNRSDSSVFFKSKIYITISNSTNKIFKESIFECICYRQGPSHISMIRNFVSFTERLYRNFFPIFHRFNYITKGGIQ